MHFNRLRLHGFKSFVEPTDLHIAPGMTGIVGPNGCGKSNLVEALRWVMGENSAKSMRGSEMDDVIFGGTATRPSRNLAEVTLELDNSKRTATTEFNHDDVIQVTRHIERGDGSDYRVNGKPVRRRDIQLLFADQATGAHSTNLVGQGQIDALIRAKPQDRRAILEEASGTSGLHARRHEAELKLKAAEQNLTRVDDVLQNFDQHIRSLKTQARQATRYRNLADHIRRTEAALLQLRWREAEASAESTKLALSEAEARVTELLSVVTYGNTARAEIAAELPALRGSEAAAAAIVQKLVLAREQIDAEMKRISDETLRCEQRLAQARDDKEREIARLTDGERAIIALQEEKDRLQSEQARIAETAPQVATLFAALNAEVERLDQSLGNLLQETANAEAHSQSLVREQEALVIQREHLEKRRAQAEIERVNLATEIAALPELAMASALVDATEKELAKRQEQAQSAEEYYREAENIQVTARDIAQSKHAELTKLQAEYDALSAVLRSEDDVSEKIIDLITVEPGLEDALAIALGEALTAGLDPAAAQHWRSLGPLNDAPALPAGVQPISQYVKAPAVLARCLSQIGVVENLALGKQVEENLCPGQIIVSRDGWAWRWDGFTVSPQAKTTTAIRLQQRNRALSLEAQIGLAETDAQNAQKALDAALAFFTQRQDEDRKAREALKAAFAAQADARNVYARQERDSTAITSKLSSAQSLLNQAQQDICDLNERAEHIERERAQQPNLESWRRDINEKRSALSELRSKQALQKSEHDHLQRDKLMCATRAQTVAQDIAAWQSRLTNAGSQIETLSERIKDISKALEELQVKPAELETRRSSLLTELTEAEAARSQAADKLITAENNLASTEQQVRRDEARLVEGRENRIRAEASLQAAAALFTTLRERMTEKLNCGPGELAAIAEISTDSSMPDVSELEQSLGKYTRERDSMGPVNLRADVEAEAVQAQVDTLQKEKDDLSAAIAKLRQGIGHLNKEARERLQNAFTQVNERFQNLFKILFNGGRAYLELVENEDPMNAGLEIFASPPGKKMQILSLLSGGERTLTALALLFAVFQTNPSPICVLDEAEAALDESNISRFCELVETIARETGTRFLIITHQRLTMARMDRLYGVTMGEKGVSQLVSVDLEGAVSIRDTGALAAEGAEQALAAVQAA